MKYFIAFLFCFLSTLAFSQGAGIRYMDTIPTHTPNPALRHSIVVYNTTNDTYYHYQDGKWKDLGILRVVDSTLQILNEQYSLGDRILNKATGEQFLVQTDSFFLVDSIYAIPTITITRANYAVWQPGFNHQGEFVLDTMDSGDYKLQVNKSQIIRGADAWLNISGIDYSTLNLQSENGILAHFNGNASDAYFILETDASNWTFYNNSVLGDLELQGSTGDFKIWTGLNSYPFVIKDNAPDTAFTINTQGEVLVNQREYDAGDYKLQVNGSSYFRHTGANFFYIDGEFGSFMTLLGNQDDATFSLTNDQATWYLRNDLSVGNLMLAGTNGKYFGITAKSGYSPSSTQNITAAGGITVTRGIMRVQGSGGAVDITADPQIVDGNDGEIVILEGMSDTNTLTLDDGTGLQLAGAASFVMGIGDVIQLMYNANRDLWIEITRSNN